MSVRIVLATRNPGKIREMSSLLAGAGVELLSAADVDAPEVAETGRTFLENAALKAHAVARAGDLWAIADDSGLEVESLGNEPGVHSSRYSAEGTDAANNARLMSEISSRGIRRPAARFVCVMALAAPEELLFTTRGEVEGWIVSEPRGESGFGYDPIFFCPELGMTFGEASPAEKESVSHRGRAMRKMVEYLLPRIHP